MSEGRYAARRATSAPFISTAAAPPSSAVYSRRVALVRAIGTAAAGAVAWGWFEAGWVRLRELRCPVPRLPSELAGVRIAHLSDFHLGMPSRSRAAVERAVAWVEERQPDVVAVTGDLLTRRSAEPLLRRLAARLPRCFAVLGNHDYAEARDPFVNARPVTDLGGATLLVDEARTIDLRGRKVQIAGLDALTYLTLRSRPESLADEGADLRILLSHYPRVVDRMRPSPFELVLSGHLHDGQITVPYGRDRLRLAHPRFPYPSGLYHRDDVTLHVSPGLGTTFVPFRFAARPEATELVLVAA